MPTYYSDALPDEETRRQIKERGLPYEVVNRPASTPALREDGEEGGDVYRSPGQGASGWPGAGNYPLAAFDAGRVGDQNAASTNYYEASRTGDVAGAHTALDAWNAARRVGGMPDYIPTLTDAQIESNRARANVPVGTSVAAPAGGTPPPVPPATPQVATRTPAPSPAQVAPIPRAQPQPVRRAPATVNPVQMAQRRQQMWPVRRAQRLPSWPPSKARF